MKILLVDCAEAKDRGFNNFARKKIEDASGECVVMCAGEVLSSSTLRGFGGVVIGGVPDNIDRYPYELDLGEFTSALEVKVPILGICFGHQQVGLKAGAELKVDEEKEKGTVRITQTLEGMQDGLFRGVPREFDAKAMHRGSVTVPEGYTLLASSEGCLNQSMADSSGMVRGVQFHPEFSGETGDMIFENFARIALDHMQASDLPSSVSGNPAA